MLKKHILLACLVLATTVAAEEPRIDQVKATQTSDGIWRFDVTISHPDTGWDHYADGWRILDMDGNELGMRTLAHPHVNEQPFTRSLSGVKIPQGTAQVQVQARDKPGGWNGGAVTVTLP
ncbi:MAG: hypothetical protein AAF665_14705 [Pseudomonadota bacterium]